METRNDSMLGSKLNMNISLAIDFAILTHHVEIVDETWQDIFIYHQFVSKLQNWINGFSYDGELGLNNCLLHQSKIICIVLASHASQGHICSVLKKRSYLL